MKKILMLCGIAFMVSCSNDVDDHNEDLNTNESLNVKLTTTSNSGEMPSVEDEIDQLFL